MLQVPFNFKPLNIKGVVGQPTHNYDKARLYELSYRGSNSFILGYVPRSEDAKAYFKQYNIEIADKNGVIRNNTIHSVPSPELSGTDFQNMMDCIKQSDGIQINSNTYICYAVDLVNSIISFEVFDAANLKEARNIARDYLSDALGIKVLIKNLRVNPNKNSKITRSYNLINAYVGQLQNMNKYCTYDRYLVGCVKYSNSLTNISILDNWINE